MLQSPVIYFEYWEKTANGYGEVTKEERKFETVVKVFSILGTFPAEVAERHGLVVPYFITNVHYALYSSDDLGNSFLKMEFEAFDRHQEQTNGSYSINSNMYARFVSADARVFAYDFVTVLSRAGNLYTDSMNIAQQHDRF
ncbi:hypothetical protein [Baaleninema simplex]|uniref:hypothetical protein n=1 Tax=Baaleninema simplex TaxID=2862350 RepID=UPI00035DD7B9|nr:hypothetical protein [Baaleninema simplex]